MNNKIIKKMIFFFMISVLTKVQCKIALDLLLFYRLMLSITIQRLS